MTCQTPVQPEPPAVAFPEPGRGLRVLVVGHTYLARIHQQKLDALARRGVGIGLLVPSNWRYCDGLLAGARAAPQQAFESFRLLSAPVVRPGHLASYLFEPFALARALAAYPCDIVQIEQEVYSFTSAEVALAAKAAGRKVVVFSWENLDRPVHPLQRAARRIVLRAADAILSGSAEGAELIRRWGFQKRIEVIPQLGVDPFVFRPSSDPHRQLFTIGYVGRLVQEKGVDLLLHALALLAEEGREFQCVICGDGPQGEGLRALAWRLGLADRIRWSGALAHEGIPELMRTLDVLVLPSRAAPRWKEQFGHVLIEAMATGIPVAGSSSGAIPEVIGRPDMIFREEDHRGLAGILERLMTGEGLRRQAGCYAIARVREHYTHDRIAERLTTLWTQILSEAPRPSLA
jgi:glycosyltransferase involved in cell wall biosynthesis